MDEFSVGEIIAQKYEVLAVAGTGGMGVVYKARQIQMDKIVAIKILSSTGQNAVSEASDARAKRFEQEARILANISHEHLGSFISFGALPGGRLYLVMEFLYGRSLREIIHDEQRLDWLRSLKICRQVCQAMAVVHAHNVTHRDLKPENIYLEPQPTPDFVKVIDFGVAKINSGAIAAAENRQQKFTQTGTIIGSINYVSPEQIKGDTVDARSDIYSLGAVLFEMLTGDRPFFSETPAAVIHKHMNEELQATSKIVNTPKFPAEFDLIVAKATAKDPAFRYQTMSDFDQDLGILESKNTGSVRTYIASPQEKAKARQNALSYLGIICGAIIIGSLSVYFFSDQILCQEAHLELSHKASPATYLHWLAIADKFNTAGKRKEAETIKQDISDSVGTGTEATFLLLKFAKYESSLGRKTEAARWATLCLNRIANEPSSHLNESEKHKMIGRIVEATKVLQDSSVALNPAMSSDFQRLMRLDYIAMNLRPELIPFFQLCYKCLCELRLQSEPDELIHLQAQINASLARAGNYKEIEKIIPQQVKVLEKSINNKRSPEIALLYLRTAVALPELNSTDRDDEVSRFNEALVAEGKRRLLNSEPKDSRNYYDVLLILCNWYQKNGQIDQIEPTLRKLIHFYSNENKDDSVVVNALQEAYRISAQTLSLQKRYDEALSAARESLALTKRSTANKDMLTYNINNKPNMLKIRFALEQIAELCIAKGQPEKCLPEFNSEIDSLQSSPSANADDILLLLENRALVYFHMKNFVQVQNDLSLAEEIGRKNHLVQALEGIIITQIHFAALNHDDKLARVKFIELSKQPPHFALEAMQAGWIIPNTNLIGSKELRAQITDWIVKACREGVPVNSEQETKTDKVISVIDRLSEQSCYDTALRIVNMALQSKYLPESEKNLFETRRIDIEKAAAQ